MRTAEEISADIRVLVQEMIHATDENGNRPTIMTGCLVAFEATAYDDAGVQMYRTDYFTLPPTGITQVAGLLSMSKMQLNHVMFGHCGDHRDD